jgi:glucose/mannose-6-phosphate isomerase
VSDLDDVAALRAADPSEMLDVVLASPEHCRRGYELGRATAGLPPADGATSIAFCGMGGSAIAGDVIRALFEDRLPVALTVVRSLELPAHCGPDTIVLASSYSGDTAETLGLFEEAVRRRCRVIALTSGGILAARADELGVARIGLPTGFPMPRAAFGYLALAPVGALEAIGLVPALRADVEEAAAEMGRVTEGSGPRAPVSSNVAKALARSIGDRVPVVWGAEGIGSVAAARWKTQLNENAKVPAFSSALPELDHNEVVGWSAGRGEGFFVVALRHEGEHPDVAARVPLSIEIARSSGASVQEVWASGRSALARMMTLCLLGDLASTYLAIARDVDPTPIEAIARLKRALADAAPAGSR